jgi:ribosome-associated toxin RatA of RatAB toxin-antitoxin module
VQMSLVEGPFSQLSGQWDFTPLGDGSSPACKVEFRLTYGFSSTTLARLVGPVFDKIAGSLVEAFVKRADEVYGTAA